MDGLTELLAMFRVYGNCLFGIVRFAFDLFDFCLYRKGHGVRLYGYFDDIRYSAFGVGFLFRLMTIHRHSFSYLIFFCHLPALMRSGCKLFLGAEFPPLILSPCENLS